MPKLCPRCERLPADLPASGTLYVAPPITEAQVALESYLSQHGFDYDIPYQGIFAISYGPGQMTEMCDGFLCKQSQALMEDTKTMVLDPGAIPNMLDFTQMLPLSTLVSRVQGKWLLDILSGERLTTHFQPIVQADDVETAFAYECLIRGRDEAGGPIPPGDMFSVARSSDLLFNLDRACRMAIIRDASEQEVCSKIFINFNPTSIYNPEFCLRTTMEAIDRYGLKPEQIVFEVVESDEVDDTGHLLKVLEYYRERGFGVALDDMGAGFSSLNLLYELKPDFMKIDMLLVQGVDKDEYKARITENILSLADKIGITSIAEGVETVGEWNWLRDHGADLLQGFLFARPAAEPPTPSAPSGV